ncbi:MAG: thioesterase family protein [Oscillospiraceae bacterium]
MNIEVGLKGHQELLVTKDNIAGAAASNEFQVLSTPFMIGHMEETCSVTMLPLLDEGYGSVGTHVDVYHTGAAPIGNTVGVDCEVIEVDGRKVTFKVIAYDEKGEIGHGTHERFIVNIDRFMKKHV